MQTSRVISGVHELDPIRAASDETAFVYCAIANGSSFSLEDPGRQARFEV